MRSRFTCVPKGVAAAAAFCLSAPGCAPEAPVSPAARCAQILPAQAAPRAAAAQEVAPSWVQRPLDASELGLIRHLSQVSWGAPEAQRWSQWYLNPDQTGLDAARYPLAFTAYAAFLAGARTPAYTEVAAATLRDTITRMLDPLIWSYIQVYWADEPTFPDPVYVENVMYSGHLLQMMMMYQLLTGDDRYATEGFDFVWFDGTVVHYDVHSLAKRLFDMMGEHETGGLPCEPDLVFIYCNDHSALALTLYDRVYGAGYLSAVERWRRYVQRHGPFRVERAPSFFRIVYLDAEGAWVPYGEAGGDAWGLGWMAPWNRDVAFLQEGWQSLLSNGRFIEDEAGVHLDASAIMEAMLVSDGTATSFLPLLARQMEGPDSTVAEGVFEWMQPYAQWRDADGDGFTEALSFATDAIDRNVVTANVAMGMFTLSDDMMQGALSGAVVASGPQLTGVDTAAVDVPLAHGLEGGGLTFQVAPAQGGVAQTRFEVTGLEGEVQVLRDGAPYAQWGWQGQQLWVQTALEASHVFEVLPAAP